MQIPKHTINQIIEAGKKLYQAGLAPATSGNYSIRLEKDQIAITVSGMDKGQLTEDDIILIDMAGKVLHSEKKSSAETLLHTSLYELYPDIGAVLHTHSLSATVLSRLYQDRSHINLEDYELQKIFPRITTHACKVTIPIFANTQDMTQLAAQVKQTLPRYEHVPAYLIAGHGLYTWGKTMQDTARHIEALEFLFNCELEILRIKGKP